MNLSFSVALIALREGKKVCRNGWNGKGMNIKIGKGVLPCEDPTATMSKEDIAATLADTEAHISHIDGVDISLFRSSETAEHTIMPTIMMKAATGSYFSWNPNILDLLADDWQILND